MRYVTGGAAALGLVAGGLALAAPAQAELAPGVYLYRSVMANGVVTDNTMQVEDCGPGCINLFNVTLNRDPGQARVQGSQYVLDQSGPAGALCPDGRAVDIVARYTFNLDGTNGVYTLNGPNPCGGAGPVGATAFTLTPA